MTNALPAGPFQPEEPGLFAEPFKLIASGGQGDFVWEASAARRSAANDSYWAEIHFPKFNGMGSTLGQIPGETCTATSPTGILGLAFDQSRRVASKTRHSTTKPFATTARHRAGPASAATEHSERPCTITIPPGLLRTLSNTLR